MLRLFSPGSGDGTSSKHYIETGKGGLSCSHHWWPIGLPLNPGECERAVLLRVAPLGTAKQRLTFDDIVTIDLGGKGIRELTISEGWLWGIAGCVPDCSEPSHLWRVK